ncbi:thiol peroxidase [candidate division KSB1 bacterium]|nr:thiol peroxidase [candidate division KSB1 bacterium]
MPLERKNVVTSKGNPVTLLGPEIKVGDKAPDFEVLDNQSTVFSSKQAAGKIRIYNVVTSLDTSICDLQTKRFNEEAAVLGDDVEILTISVDLPTAQKRWCGAAGVDKVKVLSDHRELSFGLAFGVAIKELRLLSRSIFIVDKSDTVRYVEYVKEVASHPDYDKALSAVKALL